MCVKNKYSHCKNGHEFTNENTYTSPKGYRQCKECNKTYNKTHYIKYHIKKVA